MCSGDSAVLGNQTYNIQSGPLSPLSGQSKGWDCPELKPLCQWRDASMPYEHFLVPVFFLQCGETSVFPPALFDIAPASELPESLSPLAQTLSIAAPGDES